MNDITKIVDQIIKGLEAEEWSKVDRLQKTMEHLVKIEVARVEASRMPSRSV